MSQRCGPEAFSPFMSGSGSDSVVCRRAEATCRLVVDKAFLFDLLVIFSLMSVPALRVHCPCREVVAPTAECSSVVVSVSLCDRKSVFFFLKEVIFIIFISVYVCMCPCECILYVYVTEKAERGHWIPSNRSNRWL